LLWVRFPP